MSCLEERVLQAYDKLHNQLDNNTTEDVALDLLLSLPSSSTVDLKDKDKFTLLHYACYNGWYRVTKELLIKCLYDPKAENLDGSTPLYFACRSGNLEIVKYLILEKNCDPKKSNKKGLVPLHNAALGGHLNIATYLIEEKQCSSTPRDSRGNTPLHLACQNGSLPIVKYFVEIQKCPPSCVTNDHFTQPLHLACQKGSLEVARYLIEEKHCNPVSVNGKGFQVIHLACKSGNLDLIRYLIENQNCKPNSVIKHMRWTPLHLACESGFLTVASYLIVDRKCDPMHKGIDDVTPFYLACRNGHLGLVKYLTEEQNCDPNCQIKNGCNPLHSACQNGHLHVAKYLIEVQHIHPSCLSSSHWTPLHLACVSGHLDIVRYLIHERHCDPSVKTYYGDTPLSVACRYRHLSIIIYLVKECMCNVLDSKIVLTDSIVKNHPEITLFLLASNKLFYEQTSFKIKSHIDTMFHPTFKVFVFGHESVGKNTLIRAIKLHSQSVAHKRSTVQVFGQDSRLSQSTRIVPVCITDHHFIMYNFSGQSSYHACHAAFLENVNMTHGCLRVLVIDLSKSVQKCVLELQYWKSFIDNLFISQCSRRQRLELVIVASHADIVNSKGENPDHKSEQIVRNAFGDQGDSYSVIVTDYRMNMSKGLKTISNRISTLSNEYKKNLDISIEVHFLKHLLQKYSMNDKLAYKFTEINEFVFSNGLDVEHLSDHLTTLSDNGELLYLKNLEDINESWIVLNFNFLFNTALFSQKAIQHYSSKAGILSLSEIKKLFPNNDPNVVTEIMIHLEICCEIDNYIVRLMIKSDSNISDQEKYILFPHLVITNLSTDNITISSQFRYGWHCRQTNDDEIFTTRFAQTVIIQLISRFICEQATPTQRITTCTVWKTGIQWRNSSGIQAFVKFVEQHCTVIVEVGSQLNEAECLHYRSKIIEMIIETKKKVLEAVKIEETSINPEQYCQQERLEYESLDRKG